MDSSRRRVLQLLGLSALGLTAKPVLNAFAVSEQAPKPEAVFKDADNALTATQWALVIDTREFESEEDIEPLVEACRAVQAYFAFDTSLLATADMIARITFYGHEIGSDRDTAIETSLGVLFVDLVVESS